MHDVATDFVSIGRYSSHTMKRGEETDSLGLNCARARTPQGSVDEMVRSDAVGMDAKEAFRDITSRGHRNLLHQSGVSTPRGPFTRSPMLGGTCTVRNIFSL